MAWLTGWNRRKLITVNGSTAGAQSDYQMLLNVGQGSGTDSAGNVYLGGNVLSTFNDLRFTKSDGSTLLSYWIEFITGVSPNLIAKVWVKLAPSPDLIPISPGTYNFYIYYNNSSASSYTNGDNALIFFDDFNGTSYSNKWDLQSLQSYSTITESGGNLTLTVTGAGGAGSLAGGSIANRVNIGNGIELHTKIVSASSNANWTRYSIDFGTGTRNEAYGTCGGATVPYDGYTLYINPPSWNTITLFRVDSGTYTSIGSASIDPNGKYIKMTYLAPNIYVYSSTDNLTWTQIIFSGSAPSKTAGKLFLAEYSCGDRGGSIVYDYLFVRKFTSPEPAWSTISSEQTLISLTINSTPSGARIWLANPSGTSYVDKGVNTNTTISNLEPGTYDIKLVLAGYADWILTNQNYTSNQTINATFAGSAYFTSTPTGASVYLDGNPSSIGTTPLTITGLTSPTSGATSLHSYSLTNAGCPNSTGSFTATAGSTINVPVTFGGYLYISSSPTGARIWLAHPSGTSYVDQGVYTNYTFTKEIGTYDAKLVLSGYQDWIGTNKTINSCATTNVPATLSPTCGTPACNLIVLSMVSKQLSRKPPGYLDLDVISICIDNLICRY